MEMRRGGNTWNEFGDCSCSGRGHKNEVGAVQGFAHAFGRSDAELCIGCGSGCIVREAHRDLREKRSGFERDLQRRRHCVFETTHRGRASVRHGLCRYAGKRAFDRRCAGSDYGGRCAFGAGGYVKSAAVRPYGEWLYRHGADGGAGRFDRLRAHHKK